MNREEAIKILRSKIRTDSFDESFEEIAMDCALTMAIVDMEKQIPKKILYIEQSYGTPWFCPECESDQIKVEFFSTDGYEPKEKVSYCWKCGQALDWSEEND